LMVVAIVGVLSAIGVTQLMRARAAANESAAIASLRAITSAQISYAGACGRGAFATDLRTLGVPSPGTTVPFLSPDLTGAVGTSLDTYSPLRPGLVAFLVRPIATAQQQWTGTTRPADPSRTRPWGLARSPWRLRAPSGRMLPPLRRRSHLARRPRRFTERQLLAASVDVSCHRNRFADQYCTGLPRSCSALKLLNGSHFDELTGAWAELAPPLL
jgi:type II secretory pathway pseudopilin PulG